MCKGPGFEGPPYLHIHIGIWTCREDLHKFPNKSHVHHYCHLLDENHKVPAWIEEHHGVWERKWKANGTLKCEDSYNMGRQFIISAKRWNFFPHPPNLNPGMLHNAVQLSLLWSNWLVFSTLFYIPYLFSLFRLSHIIVLEQWTIPVSFFPLYNKARSLWFDVSGSVSWL